MGSIIGDVLAVSVNCLQLPNDKDWSYYGKDEQYKIAVTYELLEK